MTSTRAFKQAIDAGATEAKALEDQFWGDRMGTLTDPFGHQWSLATHVEDVPEEEIGTALRGVSVEAESRRSRPNRHCQKQIADEANPELGCSSAFASLRSQ